MIQDALQDYITNANTKLHFITINSRILKPLFDTAFKTSETRKTVAHLPKNSKPKLKSRLLQLHLQDLYPFLKQNHHLDIKLKSNSH